MQSRSHSKTNVMALAREKWASSGLTDAMAKRLKLRALTGEETRKLNSAFHAAGALFIPYFDSRGRETKFYRIRYLEPLPGFAGAFKKPQRYAQAPGTLNEVYLPPLMKRPWADVMQDTETVIYITEGELKAACATARGLPTIGLGGVDVWRSKKRKLPLLPQLTEVKWKDRKVVIVFDSDAATNPDVVRAQRQLSRVLLELGAMPVIAALSPSKDGKKQGLDDFLVAHDVEDLLAVVERAQPLADSVALWELNEEVVFVRDPGLVIERATGQRMSPNMFVNSVYANRTFIDYSGEKPKRVNAAKRWLEWAHRFEARKVTYAPGKPQFIDGCWNLWTGWGVEPKRGNVDPWHRLLDFLFKGEPPEVRQWFERWCAYPLQHPGTKLFSSVVMWGVVHGTGKTLVGYTLRDIYGSNGMEIKNHHLSSQFNEWAENKQFIIGDEVTGSDKRVDADRLKGLITQEEIVINAKFIPVYRVPDCVNYYFTSNHPDAFFLEDSDRRFFIHEVIGGPGPRAMYDQYDEWRRSGGPAHLFDYLLRLDLGDFNPKGHALSTRAKEEMMLNAKSDLGVWCRELLEDPVTHLRPLGETMAKKAELLTASQLLRCYDPEGASRVTANGLGRELKRCGVRQLPVVKTSAGTQRLYVVRSAEKWLNGKWDPKKAAEHWEGLFGAGAKRF